MTESFTFGIPLIARAAAADWSVVERVFARTLRSVLAQTDGDYRVLLAAHDVPEAWTALVGGDPRFSILSADWPTEPPSPANDDGGRKKWLVKQAVREGGGGLVMFLDADDWVDRALVATARATIGPEMTGAVIAHGFALDAATSRAAAFPMPGLWDGSFHELCGSSTVARLLPEGGDPYELLGSHHQWPEAAARAGVRLASLNCWGVYTVGTPQSHSEHFGPFAGWKQQFVRGVREGGAPLDAARLAQFGQDGV